MPSVSLSVGVALAVLLTVTGRAADPTASEVAQSLQRKIDAVQDFSADFVHTYQGGVLKKQLTERGTVLIKKPGKMRWDYTAPEKKLFVSDGVKVYFYLPADKQVMVSSVPPNGEATTPALFLAGKGNILRDFTVQHATVPDAPAGSVALRLTPKRQEREYEWLNLVVDRATLQLRMLITSDQQGGTSAFLFTNLHENAGIADKEFVFVMPRGVDVITEGH